MNLPQLEYFRVLAKTEHYTNAAKILSIAQPSLTHSIKSLEKELNVRLFDKDGRHIKLNRYGSFFLKCIENVLDELDESKQQLQLMVDPSLGTINLAYLYSLGPQFIPRTIQQFQKDEKNQRIKFNLTESTTSEIIHSLENGTIDLAFTAKINDDAISCIPLYKEELCIITPPNHPLAAKASISVQDLAEYPFITYYSKSGIRTIINELFSEASIQPQIAFQVSDDLAICGFVEANLGIAIIPRIWGMESYMKSYKIAFHSFANPIYHRTIYLSFITKNYIGPLYNEVEQLIKK